MGDDRREDRARPAIQVSEHEPHREDGHEQRDVAVNEAEDTRGTDVRRKEALLRQVRIEYVTAEKELLGDRGRGYAGHEYKHELGGRQVMQPGEPLALRLLDPEDREQRGHGC